MSERVLLTGGRGFIGRHVQKLLVSRGYEVFALTSGSESDGIEPEVTGISCNVFDSQKLVGELRNIKADKLLHLAWYTKHGLFWESVENLRWLAASTQLISTFVECGGERVVCAGTCAEYDWRLSNGVFQEETSIVNPATLYGAAKNSLNAVASKYLARQGVGFCWGRLFFLYGTGEQSGRFVTYICKSLLQGERVDLTRGTQKRDFMYSEDAARAFVDLLESRFDGTFNIATGKAVRLAEIALAIGEQLGRPELINLGGRPDNPEEPASIVANVHKLRKELGFQDRFSLQQGVSRMVVALEDSIV